MMIQMLNERGFALESIWPTMILKLPFVAITHNDDHDFYVH